MVRSIEELEDILDEIQKKVSLANRNDELDELLKKWGLFEFVDSYDTSEHYKSGKIVVIGNTDVKEAILTSICKDCGIDKERLEFCLDYSRVQKYNYKKMQYNSAYSVVLFGPIPHSVKGKSDTDSSIISEMETEKGYPPVVRLLAGNELKITKTNFKRAIYDLLNNKTIAADY